MGTILFLIEINSFSRWLHVFLDTLGNLVIFFAALFAVLQKDSLSGGQVGLSVSFALQVSFSNVKPHPQPY